MKAKTTTSKRGAPKGNQNRTGKAAIAPGQKYELVFELTLQGHTGRRIADLLGLTSSQVYEVQGQDKFRQELQEARDKRRAAAMSRFEEMAELAADAHVEVLRLKKDEAHPDFFKTIDRKLEASNSVLDRIGLGRESKVKQEVQQQVTTFSVEFEGRTPDDLEHYAIHGYFPEEAPKKRELT